ncbi:UDP-N-acetylmuramate--L-alanine ligase, partial [bacterium]|nr:UDP-N-acetylmuramate--L-alanine ligase [bacterium]
MTHASVPASIHFVAMGGAGVEPLARWCHEKGVAVTGSDRDPDRVAALRAVGIRCVEGHRARHLPIGVELLVHSTAVPQANPEIQEARGHGIPVMDRPAFLARLFHSARHGVAITGTHGKTTTTALVAWMLESAGRDPEAIIGGPLAP